MVYWIEASNVERKPHTTSARESRVLRCPEMARVLHVLQQFPHNYRTQLMKTFQDSQGENMARYPHVIKHYPHVTYTP